jgi:hypothetical protein
VLKVRVKVESDNNKEEESSDNDANEDKEEEEQPPAQPVARIEQPAYVAPRPNYILMNYDNSMFETVIPDNKVIRPINCWATSSANRTAGICGAETGLHPDGLRQEHV